MWRALTREFVGLKTRAVARAFDRAVAAHGTDDGPAALDAAVASAERHAARCNPRVFEDTCARRSRAACARARSRTKPLRRCASVCVACAVFAGDRLVELVELVLKLDEWHVPQASDERAASDDDDDAEDKEPAWDGDEYYYDDAHTAAGDGDGAGGGGGSRGATVGLAELRCRRAVQLVRPRVRDDAVGGGDNPPGGDALFWQFIELYEPVRAVPRFDPTRAPLTLA
jgi:hypothetical protein